MVLWAYCNFLFERIKTKNKCQPFPMKSLESGSTTPHFSHLKIPQIGRASFLNYCCSPQRHTRISRQGVCPLWNRSSRQTAWRRHPVLREVSLFSAVPPHRLAICSKRCEKPLNSNTISNFLLLTRHLTNSSYLSLSVLISTIMTSSTSQMLLETSTLFLHFSLRWQTYVHTGRLFSSHSETYMLHFK